MTTGLPYAGKNIPGTVYGSTGNEVKDSGSHIEAGVKGPDREIIPVRLPLKALIREDGFSNKILINTKMDGHCPDSVHIQEDGPVYQSHKPGTALYQYWYKLENMPRPGMGENYHPYILGIANHGIWAGLAPESIVDDILRYTPAGGREVSCQEVENTVETALRSYENRDNVLSRKGRIAVPPLLDHNRAKEIIAKYVEKGKPKVKAFLKQAEGYRTDVGPFPDGLGMLFLLRELYEPEEKIFIGPETRAWVSDIRPVREWIAEFEFEYKHILYLSESGFEDDKILHDVSVKTDLRIGPNPFTGKPAKGKDGKLSRRCRNAVKAYKYVVAEFDDPGFSCNDQLAFWAGTGLNISAVVYSGNKSVHVWLPVNGVEATEAEWIAKVREQEPFVQLMSLGVDPLVIWPEHLVRLPGVWRSDTGKFQTLLAVSKEGGCFNV